MPISYYLKVLNSNIITINKITYNIKYDFEILDASYKPTGKPTYSVNEFLTEEPYSNVVDRISKPFERRLNKVIGKWYGLDNHYFNPNLTITVELSTGKLLIFKADPTQLKFLKI